MVNIFKCLPIFAWWDFQGLYSLGLALLKSVGKYSETVKKTELDECMLLLKMLPKQSVGLTFSCQLHLTYKEFVAVKIGEHFPQKWKAFGVGGSIFHRNMKKSLYRCHLYCVCM